MGVGSGEGVSEPVDMWILRSHCSRSRSSSDALAPHAVRLPCLFATPPPAVVPPPRRGTLPRACARRAPSVVLSRCLVVERHPPVDYPLRLEAILQIVQVYRLVLQRAPQPFDEHVVQTTTAPVHRAPYPGRLQLAGERDAGELAALIGVEDLGNAEVFQSVRQRLQAEGGVHRVGQPPGQHPPARPVHDRHQVQKSSLHRDVGVGSDRSALSSFDRWVSPARPPNRTCDSHRIRLSMCSCRRTATRIGRRPLVQLCLHREYSGLRFTRGWPQIADIHQRPPRSVSLLRAHWTPSPCTRLSQCSDYYGSSVPLRQRRPATDLPRYARLAVAPAGTNGVVSHVHSRTLQRGRCPAMPLQPRHRYSAVVHRGLPGRRHQPAKEFPARPKPAGTRCNPAHICQVGAGGAILRGFRPLVPHVHLLVSLAGPTPSDSAGMSRLCRGCFCLHRCPPDRVAPSFNRSAATNRWQWSFTTAGFRAPRGARCPRTTPGSGAQS